MKLHSLLVELDDLGGIPLRCWAFRAQDLVFSVQEPAGSALGTVQWLSSDQEDLQVPEQTLLVDLCHSESSVPLCSESTENWGGVNLSVLWGANHLSSHCSQSLMILINAVGVGIVNSQCLKDTEFLRWN